MTQVFADGEQLGGAGLDPSAAPLPGWPMVRQRSAGPDLSFGPPDAFGPGLTAGKGVRPVRCVGCAQDTLPRPDDNAPLCTRCSETLAETGPRAAPSGRWLPRWFSTY